MSPKIIITLKLFLVMSVSARSMHMETDVGTKEEDKITHVPASDSQKTFLAQSVCIDLEMYLRTEEAMNKCIEHFRWNMDRDQSGVQIRCRSTSSVTLEVEPSDRFQLVLLVPDPNTLDDPYSSIISIVQPNTKYITIGITQETNYSTFSTILDEHGTPLVWHHEARIYSWKSPMYRKYDVQVQFQNTGNLTEGLITWNRTGELDACFQVLTRCEKGDLKIIEILPSDSTPNVTLEVPLNDSCFTKVTGLYGTTRYDFLTPTSKDEATELTPPSDIVVTAEEDGDSWTVRVAWPKQSPTPELYNVTIRADAITSIIVSGNETEVFFRDVSGEGLYNVSVCTILEKKVAHTSRRAYFPTRQSGAWRWAGAAGGAVGAAVAAALCWLRFRKCTVAPEKPQALDSKPLEDMWVEAAGVESWSSDGWEMKAEMLQLHEVVGEGAFGVVRRATLAPHGREVAVKMLKDFPSPEEMRAFRLEMELMKSVGAHAHVVSLLGCCSARRPLIVAEYCSQGDLLGFLRCSWDVIVSKRNAKYYNNNIYTPDYRNDLFKCKVPQEHCRLVVNKMYDLQGSCDTELTALDLLSFCRQIAMGMEFLASNRLVHRDLAARNILVTGDRTLKIADFGLSRDVYEESQYQQKGNGKMPLKWMALESLTRRIYTSQSDVWSFGVVLWEVVTVGGAPYPDVPVARLPRLLRAGYRMPRPHNCSKQLYDLMQSCWRASPRERPTFAELHTMLDDLLDGACADEYLSLELDDEPPPTPRAQRYLNMIIRAKRNWTRGESYERPLKAPHNHYTSPPVTAKAD